MPISGRMGGNPLIKSVYMKWWLGLSVPVGKETVHVDTLFDIFDKCFRVPERPSSAPLRMPISECGRLRLSIDGFSVGMLWVLLRRWSYLWIFRMHAFDLYLWLMHA